MFPNPAGRMGRRRLLLPDADDDEDDEDDDQRLENAVLARTTSVHAPPANPHREEPLEISDDDDEDFVDVPDAFSPPSPPPPPADGVHENHGESSPRMPVGVDGESTNYPIDHFLRGLGLRLRRAWLESCLAHLSVSRPGFQFLDDAAKAKLCFEQFLFSDMNFSGGGVLPASVSEMHGVVLEGPYVLQVDEIANISYPLRERHQEMNAGSKRCLKLSLTDGVQRAYGMEYRPINAIKVLSPSGLKIAICNVHVRRGLLVLVPEVVEILGGMVDELEAARGRFINEISKPPRGRRKEPTLPLSKRASLAAWPTSVGNGAARGHPAMPSAPSNLAADGRAEQVRVPCMSENTLTGAAQRGAADSSLNNNGGDVHMADEARHPLVLSEDKEAPFTYLACFLAKRAAKDDDGLSFIRGRIKCFLTGVKSFQFKRRSTFELKAYVDDGSLISEVIIDHRVVEKGIGHSPEAVTAALSSSDRTISGGMRDAMKKFQLFLIKFEGTLTLEMKQGETTPVAVEMDQGFPTSDAWPLLTRLNTFTASLVPPR